MNKQNCDFPCYQQYRNASLPHTSSLTRIGLVIFDMDGVLIDAVSSWKHVHDHFQTSNEASVHAYVKGEIDDEEFIRRDVYLWKKQGVLITEEYLSSLLSNMPLMSGAKKTLSFLQRREIPTAIVSAGLDILAKKTAEQLGIDYVYANGIQTDKDGRLTGEGIIGVRLMYKDETINHISKTLHIPTKEMVAIGNSCFDIPMLTSCGLGIAFNPEDDCIREHAEIIVEGKDLSQIIPHLEKYIPKKI